MSGPEPRSGRTRGPTWLLVALGLPLVVAGALLAAARPALPGSEPGPTAVDSVIQGLDVAGSAPGTTPASERASSRPALARSGGPDRLRLPALGVDAPVVPVPAPQGVLTPPDDPQVLGWWADGARPGADRGSSLVAGHTVRTGGGALDDLEHLLPGDAVQVLTRRGRIDYVVRGVTVLGRGELADRASRLFDQQVPGRLVLVTCEDWDGTGYRSNVIVTARRT